MATENEEDSAYHKIRKPATKPKPRTPSKEETVLYLMSYKICWQFGAIATWEDHQYRRLMRAI